MAFYFRHPFPEEFDTDEEYQEAVKLYDLAEDDAAERYMEEKHFNHYTT